MSHSGPEPSTRKTTAVKAVAVAILALVSPGCRRDQIAPPTDVEVPSRTFAATSYINGSSELDFIVDVRVPRLSGPTEFMPLAIAVVKKTPEQWEIAREHFVLELPDRTRLPVASHSEFLSDYGRARMDLRTAQPFTEALVSNYREPPYFWIQLDFFPPPGSPTVPRERLDLLKGHVAVGFLYFRLPESPPTAGRYKLLFSPRGGSETYVVDFAPFKNPS